MSNMELRSSRSRSKTPLWSQEFVDREVIEAGNHVEQTVVRTTRRTTAVKSNDNTASSTEELLTSHRSKPSRKSTSRSERSLRSRLLKTSDYSSEDGDNEVSSTKLISQNEKNQLIEDSRSASNGSDMPALELYRKSGRYWDVYPKTDWTYSYHSKDRVEIAPGVVAMPNMSRKTIHALDESTKMDFYANNVSHKNVSTEDTYTTRSQHTSQAIKRNLFGNSQSDYLISRRKSSHWSSVKTVIVTIFTTVFSVFYYFYKMQTSWLSHVHNFASKVMLMDTWLLWKSRPRNKTNKLVLLCLIPLLLLAGYWLLSTLGSVLYGAFSNVTLPAIISSSLFGSVNERHEREALNSPPPPPQESYTTIINDYETKISHNPELIDSKHQVLIENLIDQINKMKQEMRLVDKLRRQDYMRLSVDLKKCCQKPIVNLESYIAGTVTDLLNNPEFLSNQKGLNEWLRALFVAKQDLEYQLGNITLGMDSKTADMVQKNNKAIMDQVAARLVDIKKTYYHKTAYSGSVTDEQIRRIVHNALAIYDADKTGLVDYAMESMGGQVITTRCTENYHYGKAVVSVLGIPLWYPVNSPRTVITPGINPGECWAFQNFPGFLVIKLANKVNIEALSIEHISRLLVPDGKISSAPKDFEVYGLKSENDKEPVKLGDFTYSLDGDPIQFFSIDNMGQTFEMIELRVISNHGNPNYTCLYRFRVHGSLYKEQDDR